jgi:hypothetical protein
MNHNLSAGALSFLARESAALFLAAVRVAMNSPPDLQEGKIRGMRESPSSAKKPEGRLGPSGWGA